MHNTHYILVDAEDKETAISVADRDVSGFGNENNWYNYVNVFQVFNKDNYEEIKRRLNELNKEFSQETIDRLKESVDINYRQGRYGMLSFYSDRLDKSLNRSKQEPYTVENLVNASEYQPYEYAEFGLTNLIDSNYYEENNTTIPNSNIWLVELDMHS